MLNEAGLATSYADLKTRSRSLDFENFPEKFVKKSLDIFADSASFTGNSGYAKAALFDLAVTAVYLEKVPTSGWYYCDRHDDPQLVYPFVNACPTCILSGHFVFVKAYKPASASIGAATSTVLSSFFDYQVKQVKGEEYEVRTLSDNGMVDAYLTGPGVLALFEIKSAPLIAFPLTSTTRKLTTADLDTGEAVPVDSHAASNVTPGQDATLLVGKDLEIPVGDVFEFSDQTHYAKILEWLSTGNNLSDFVENWSQIFEGYADPTQRTAFHWLTNGCGVPRPRPHDWPRRSSGGYESISDGKSSVGMDRTDDLKKGIYQVLKISTHYKEFFPVDDLEIFVALISNIHAVKHHYDYLQELEDVLWTIDSEEKGYVERLESGELQVKPGKLYNLFDGVISFTEPHFRAKFLEEIYGHNN